MKIFRLLSVVCLSVFIFSCSKDGRDDTVVNMSDLTGKFWYNNRWAGDKYAYTKDDVLQVVKFEKNGVLSVMDFGGRVERTAGTWTSKNNSITQYYTNGGEEVWDVLHSGDDYINAIINGQGTREYSTDAGYLENLTADAFLVNEYTAGNTYRTHIGVDVRGNRNIREAAMIVAVEQVIPLRNQAYYWCERNPENGDYIDFKGEEQDIRFYFKIGKDQNIKLQDRIYTENLPERSLSDFALNASNLQGVSALTVTWQPYASSSIYYRIDILNERMELTNPYFVSRIQPVNSGRLEVKTGTAGEVNRMSDLKSGDKYVVRLAAILYEPGTDVINDEYAYANVQAVTYVIKSGIWE